jgi:dTDP-4-amino-4,6-dideoxygalactose transaminase
MAKLALLGGDKTKTKPFPQWPMYDNSDLQAFDEVLKSGVWGVGGTKVKEFEEKFARFQDAEFGVCCCNGTVALEIAIRACGIGAGDEVIVTPYTFIASASSVLFANAVPVFVDVEADTYSIDPAKIEAVITDKTKAIMAVHIAGCPADMDAIMGIAKKHNLYVIEDCAQAHGAEWNGRKVGAIGDIGTFSFQSSKNLAAGEGGMVVTNNRELAEAAWSIHNCGRVPNGAWYEHRRLGANFRLTEFQAALLLSQMRFLKDHIKTREENGQYLDSKLNEIAGVNPMRRDPRVTTHAWHLYMFRFNSSEFEGLSREKFIEALNAEGVPCSSGYVPLYREGMFKVDLDSCPVGCSLYGRKMDYDKISLPVVENACTQEAVWLYQYMLLGDKQDMDEIAAAVSKIRENAKELI